MKLKKKKKSVLSSLKEVWSVWLKALVLKDTAAVSSIILRTSESAPTVPSNGFATEHCHSKTASRLREINRWWTHPGIIRLLGFGRIWYFLVHQPIPRQLKRQAVDNLPWQVLGVRQQGGRLLEELFPRQPPDSSLQTLLHLESLGWVCGLNLKTHDIYRTGTGQAVRLEYSHAYIHSISTSREVLCFSALLLQSFPVATVHKDQAHHHDIRNLLNNRISLKKITNTLWEMTSMEDYPQSH